MKRTPAVLAVLGLVVAPLSAVEAREAGRVERTVQGRYAAYPTPVTGCNEPLGSWACLVVRTRSAERSFTARVADRHGQPVQVNVYSEGAHLASFCGRTRRPVAITPGATLEFDIGQGRAPFTPLPCPERAVKTTGTITVRLVGRS